MNSPIKDLWGMYLFKRIESIYPLKHMGDLTLSGEWMGVEEGKVRRG